MKYKMKIAILSFLTLFLSALNLKNGLIFNVTDNTEHDALFSNIEEKNDKKDAVKAEIKTVNTPKTVKTATKANTKTSSAKNSITVGGQTLSITSGTVLKDKVQTPKNTAAKYQKMIYGHNTLPVFRALKNIGVGSTFTVTLNGKTEKYKVIGKETLPFKEAKANGGLFYSATYKSYESAYGKYDLTLMTCAGQDLGGGKASHRLVVFARKV